MSEHPEESTSLGIRENKLLKFPVRESNKSRFLGKIRYWWCWFAAGTLLLLIGTPTIPLFWTIRKKMWLYPFAVFGARTWLRACGAQVRVSGLEKLDPSVNYVFVSNHRSYLDTATIFTCMGRKMGLVAKKELLKAPIMGQGMGFVNVIAIDRSNPERSRASMERAREVMEAGSSFGVFAEGTRAMPGELLPFKKGAFHLAIQTKAPVVPIAIKETDWMMGKKEGVCFPGVIDVVVCDPIPTGGMTVERDLMGLLLRTREAVAGELGK